MSLVTVCFIRKTGKRVPRGGVADIPFSSNIIYTTPFIVVDIESSEIPVGLENNSTVRLSLETLMEQYPNKTVKVEDENGDMVDSVRYGYFHEKGTSSKPYPIITISEVLYE